MRANDDNNEFYGHVKDNLTVMKNSDDDDDDNYDDVDYKGRQKISLVIARRISLYLHSNPRAV